MTITSVAASPLPLERELLADRQSRIRGGCLATHLCQFCAVQIRLALS
jgi:hypothetical protein